MGAINKHPSCTKTWENTTRASKEISLFCASIFTANVHLETILLNEFEDAGCDEHVLLMMEKAISESISHLNLARGHIVNSINTAYSVGNPYKKEFSALNGNILSQLWDKQLLVACSSEVQNIVSEIKDDHLSTAKRFILALDKLEKLTLSAGKSLTDAGELAKKGQLREALACNEIPLQANFAILLSNWLQFMKEYLVDSLVATEIVFHIKKAEPLVG